MRPTNKLVLGTVQFGLDYGINNIEGKVSVSNIKQILSLCKNNNITTLDTSHAYGNSESILGETADTSFRIISKYPKTQDNVRNTFLHSLSMLKKDKLYGYLIHHFDFFKEKPSIWEEFKELKQENLVQKIGFSLYSTNELDYILSKKINFDLIQFPYNIFDRSFEPYLQELKNNNVEIHVRSVFLQGLFFKNTNELPEQLLPLKPYLKELAFFCKQNNVSITELAINGVIHNKNIDGVLVGVDSAAQLLNNINSVYSEYPINMASFIASIKVKEKELLQPKNWN